MNRPSLKRSFFQRLLGKPATTLPLDSGCWTNDTKRIVVDLDRAPELSQPYGALRIEASTLPRRILVVRDAEGNYRAYCNHCNHGGRHLDPVPGTEYLQCCSVGKSTYTVEGEVVSGPAALPLTVYPTHVEGHLLYVDIA